MSLFDVIKYPISTPVTKEELEAVPSDIYNDWVTENFQRYDEQEFLKKSKWVVPTLINRIDVISEKYKLLDDLRKRIREYDAG